MCLWIWYRFQENCQKKKNIKINVGEIGKLKIKKKFDLITLNKVLEHVENPVNFLKNSIKFLKKDGLIYIEVPDSKAKIKLIGIRPGEKLHEVMCPNEEVQNTLEFKKNYIIY